MESDLAESLTPNGRRTKPPVLPSVVGEGRSPRSRPPSDDRRPPKRASAAPQVLGRGSPRLSMADRHLALLGCLPGVATTQLGLLMTGALNCGASLDAVRGILDQAQPPPRRDAAYLGHRTGVEFSPPAPLTRSSPPFPLSVSCA